MRFWAYWVGCETVSLAISFPSKYWRSGLQAWSKHRSLSFSLGSRFCSWLPRYFKSIMDGLMLGCSAACGLSCHRLVWCTGALVASVKRLKLRSKSVTERDTCASVDPVLTSVCPDVTVVPASPVDLWCSRCGLVTVTYNGIHIS
ncbi:hypothetical protein N656DRAFT_7138 [Canariomyces notabilis]|uniref:Uncharacterized protein n=1 Tax=Canariomyces notabilis TaxID=2074819 RepID=A0AAN6TM88_9PEZI|nr:hypothetical protein N656DRAFT_7138 [Canariomyces arenarius]